MGLLEIRSLFIGLACSKFILTKLGWKAGARASSAIPKGRWTVHLNYGRHKYLWTRLIYEVLYAQYGLFHFLRFQIHFSINFRGFEVTIWHWEGILKCFTTLVKDQNAKKKERP